MDGVGVAAGDEIAAWVAGLALPPVTPSPLVARVAAWPAWPARLDAHVRGMGRKQVD